MINAVSAKQARRLFCIFFGSEIGNWMENSSCFLNEEFSFLSCIGLANDTTNLLFHHALLIARYHIYFSKQKGLNPSWELFFGTFLSCLDYEKRYAVKSGIISKFNAKWGAFIEEYDFQFFRFYCLRRDVRRAAFSANSLETLLVFQMDNQKCVMCVGVGVAVREYAGIT